MRQRAWILVLSGGLCLAVLPGCAGSGQFLLKYFRPDAEQQPAETTKVLPRGSGSGQGPETVGPELTAGPHAMVEPGTNDPPVKHTDELPPGQRVVEFMKAAPVLTPQHFPDTVQPPPPVVPTQVIHQATIVPATPKPEDPLAQAVILLLNKKPEEALEYLKRCPADNQEFFMRLLPALAVLKDKGISQLTTTELAALQEQLQAALQNLREHSDLVVDRMCLCERIAGYGHYTALPADHGFKAGVGKYPGDTVNVYVEVRNLSGVLENGYYTTRLNGTVSIRDRQGDTKWSYNYRKREQPLQSREPRSDCHRCYDFCVPPGVPPGHYTLTIEVVDETCQPHRVAQKSVDFQVIAP
jgi:hypothetical protein